MNPFFADPPGQRFMRRHERLRGTGIASTVAGILAGVVVVAVGVILLFIPGPGLLTIAAGLTLLAGRSARVSGWLDRGELAARSTSPTVRVAAITLGMLAAITVTAVATARWLA